jgi:hypothetical protein
VRALHITHGQNAGDIAPPRGMRWNASMVNGNATRPNGILQNQLSPSLSGLLRCAACGAGMSTNGKDRGGRVRVRCPVRTESGSCPNPQTFQLDRIEAVVLRELQHPALTAEYG